MARIRTFIGVALDKAIRDRTVALQEMLGRTGTEAKWVEPENLHVTMLFLGEVDEREVANVCGIVSQVSAEHSSFLMSVESAGCFPNARRPRILWVGVKEGAQSLCDLHDALEIPLQEWGYRREERKYTPHITLGRVKSDRSTDTLAAALVQHAGWKGGEILVRELHVMGSQLTPQGPVYTVLSRAKLAGPS
jgi:RNA 2',3'-cyclic 3'-phosphodiesterase